MFVSPYNERIIFVFAQEGQIWSRSQVHRKQRKENPKIQYKLEWKTSKCEGKKNNSTQYSYFFIAGAHTNKYLSNIECTPSLFFE